jgi:hypothetical protein
LDRRGDGERHQFGAAHLAKTWPAAGPDSAVQVSDDPLFASRLRDIAATWLANFHPRGTRVLACLKAFSASDAAGQGTKPSDRESLLSVYRDETGHCDIKKP